jgi:hypothetical protein
MQRTIPDRLVISIDDGRVNAAADAVPVDEITRVRIRPLLLLPNPPVVRRPDDGNLRAASSTNP